MKLSRLITALILFQVGAAGAYNVSYTVNTSSNKKAISPYIYGANTFGSTYVSATNDAENWTIKRQGGDGCTAYNWENNNTNNGNNWGNANTTAANGIAANQRSIPAIVTEYFHNSDLAQGCASLLQIQMAGWVAADGAGQVT